MGLVIFGGSNIVSDLFDCALALGMPVEQVVTHLPEPDDGRSLPLAQRLDALAALGARPGVVTLDEFAPQPGQHYLLGPTTPARAALARLVQQRHGLEFCTLVHPTAYVSPLSTLSPGVFIGANSVIGPGARLAPHVFINRGVTIGHDTSIGAYSRVQPGSNVGGLTRIGAGVTVGIGATVIERLVIGDGAFIGAGAVVTGDVVPRVLMVGIPARFKKTLGDPE